MKKLISLVMVVAMVLVGTTCAFAEMKTWEYASEETGIIVEIGQDSEDYSKEYISIANGRDDLAVKVIIWGHPERSESLSEVLAFFGVTNAWSGLSGRLDYLKVLVDLGLDEGNI